MSDEAEGKEGGEEEEKSSGEEGGGSGEHVEKIAKLQSELAEAQKVVQVYNQLNARYRSDEKYREGFDRIWKGEDATVQAQSDEEVDPLEAFKTENQKRVEKLEKDLYELRNMYGSEKIGGARERINLGYDQRVRVLAEKMGYDYGTEAYEILHSNVKDEAAKLAAKFGLVDDSGRPDPLREYNDEFITQAFKNAYDKHKKVGFDDAWKRRKDALKQEEDSKKQKLERAEYDKFLTPEYIKKVGRGKALEHAIKAKFKGQNFKFSS